jgi:hypothetical protein
MFSTLGQSDRLRAASDNGLGPQSETNIAARRKQRQDQQPTEENVAAPGSLQYLKSSYKAARPVSPSQFVSKNAEYMATARARKAASSSPRERQRVFENLMSDEASVLFVEYFLEVPPKELAALRLLAVNFQEINASLNADHGAVCTNEVRHFKKVVCAIVAGRQPRISG